MTTGQGGEVQRPKASVEHDEPGIARFTCYHCRKDTRLLVRSIETSEVWFFQKRSERLAEAATAAIRKAQQERDEARGWAERLEKQLSILRHRECLCPDCRDKVKPGECPRCAMQTAQRERDAARAALAELHRCASRCVSFGPTGCTCEACEELKVAIKQAEKALGAGRDS